MLAPTGGWQDTRPTYGGVLLGRTNHHALPVGPTPTAMRARDDRAVYCSRGIGDAVPAGAGLARPWGQPPPKHPRKEAAGGLVRSENKRKRGDQSVLARSSSPRDPFGPAVLLETPSVCCAAARESGPWRRCGSRPPGSRSRSPARWAPVSLDRLWQFSRSIWVECPEQLGWARTDNSGLVMTMYL